MENAALHRAKVPGIVNVVYRSNWDDPNALWLAAVGGRANISHGHMDGGSFELESGGVRWVYEVETYHYDTLRERGIQLWEWGAELPKQQRDLGREQVYAWGSQGHNTLTVDGRFHDPNGSAILVESGGEVGDFFATFDLTAVLGEAVESATRTFRVKGEAVVVEDAWQADDEEIEMTSRFHTEAAVEVDGQTATLAKDGRQLLVEVLEPADAKLVARPMSEAVSEWDKPLDGVTVVDVVVPTRSSEERVLRVEFRTDPTKKD